MKPFCWNDDGKDVYVHASIGKERNSRPYCVAIRVCNEIKRFRYKTLPQALIHYMKLGKDRALATVEKVSEYDITIS